MQCLGTGWPGTNTTASLGMYECDREALNLRWHCRTLGDQLSLLLGGRSSNTSKAGSPERGDQTRSGQWRIYGSDEDLCARPYYGERLLAGQAWGSSRPGPRATRADAGVTKPWPPQTSGSHLFPCNGKHFGIIEKKNFKAYNLLFKKLQN